MSATPSISVIMATLGRPENLVELVSTVLAEEAVRHFVVVVDGEDADSMAVLATMQASFDRLVFVQGPGAGQLRALEIGVTLTDAEVVLLLDDDVVPTPGLAGRHARAHASEPGLVLVGTMPVQLPARRADIGSLLYARDYLAHCARIESGEYQVLDNLWLGNVSIRRSDCLSVGLYSCAFTASYHADRDLGIRLGAAGLVGRYDPSLVAAHRHRRSVEAFQRDSRRRGAGLVHLHQVHKERLGPFDPKSFTSDLPAALGAVVRRFGSAPCAPRIARALLALSALPGLIGWESGRLAVAKLARRIMLFWGTTAGEGPTPHADPVREVSTFAPDLSLAWTRTPEPPGPVQQTTRQFIAG